MTLSRRSAHQREFAITITETVLASEFEGPYLGSTLQAADVSSPDFGVDNTKQLVLAAEYLDQVLTTEQRRVFDVTKLSNAIQN